MALRVINCYKLDQPSYCELYVDLISRQYRCTNICDMPKEWFLQLNHEYIGEAFHFRRHESMKNCLIIVDQNLAGNESIGASWF